VILGPPADSSRRPQDAAVHASELIGLDLAGRKTYPTAMVDDVVAG
jgi:hypothetical protein